MVLCKYKEFMRGKKTGFYIIFTRIFCTCKILDLYTCKKHYRVQNANILMLVFVPNKLNDQIIYKSRLQSWAMATLDLLRDKLRRPSNMLLLLRTKFNKLYQGPSNQV